MASIPEYTLSSDGSFEVTEDVLNDYNEWGIFMVRQLLDKEELSMLKATVEADTNLRALEHGKDDGEGKITKMCIWDDPSDDITGAIARSEKCAGTMEKLLGDEVYHYHSKFNAKDPHEGGAFIWHQDYGYWYKNGCLFPDMGTVFIPVDDTNRENGCLKIIPKSHKAGRIEHGRVADQAGADLERVAYLEKALGLVYAEMNAGDGLFFHCNLLHRSDQNRSDKRRWAYLVSYNTKRNNPVKKHHHPCYTPMTKVPNSAIKECVVPTGPTAIHRSRTCFSGPEADTSHHDDS